MSDGNTKTRYTKVSGVEKIFSSDKPNDVHRSSFTSLRDDKDCYMNNDSQKRKRYSVTDDHDNDMTKLTSSENGMNPTFPLSYLGNPHNNFTLGMNPYNMGMNPMLPFTMLPINSSLFKSAPLTQTSFMPSFMPFATGPPGSVLFPMHSQMQQTASSPLFQMHPTSSSSLFYPNQVNNESYYNFVQMPNEFQK